MRDTCEPGDAVARSDIKRAEMVLDTEPRGRGDRGFTLVEMLMAVVLFGIVMGVGFTGLRSFNEASIVDRASRTVASDVTLTRSHAIRRRADVSLVADESGRSYAIREAASGDTILVRWFGGGSDLPLTTLDVQTGGDSFTFNARGLLAGGAQVDVEVERLGKAKRIRITPLGRTHITVSP